MGKSKCGPTRVILKRTCNKMKTDVEQSVLPRIQSSTLKIENGTFKDIPKDWY